MKKRELVKIPIESAKLEWSELALRAEGREYFVPGSGTETHKQITEYSSTKKIISHKICNVKKQNGGKHVWQI